MTGLDRKEIERMLAAGDDPKPPAGLLERLQAEIPEQYPQATPLEPRRRVSSWRGWAVAASILAVVGMSYVVMRVVDSPEYREEMSIAQSDAAESRAPMADDVRSAAPLQRQDSDFGAEVAEATPEQQASAKDAAPAAAPGMDDERTFAMAAPPAEFRAERSSVPESPADRDFSPQPAAMQASPAPPPPPSVASATVREVEGGVSGGVVGGVVGGVIGGVVGGPVSQESRPTSDRAANEAAVPASTPRGRVQDGRAKAAMSALEPARGSTSGQFVDTEADPVSSFGLRVGTSSWGQVRAALLEGRLPAAQAVRIDELINYFTYSDPEPSRGEVTVRTEGAESPSRRDESEHLLRVGVRVSPSEVTRVLGAKMQVEFEPAAVESYRLVGFENGRRSSGITLGEDLPPGQRTTALYELRIRPQVPSTAQVGTVRLQYETSAAGKKQLEQVIRRSDLSRSWADTSREIQLAAVVADWGKVLRGEASAETLPALERRAEAVAKRWPNDRKVTELLDLIRATARILG